LHFSQFVPQFVVVYLQSAVIGLGSENKTVKVGREVEEKQKIIIACALE